MQKFKAWIIWGALTLSIPIYVFVGYVVTQDAVDAVPLAPNLKLILIVVSCAMAASSFFIAKKFLSRPSSLPPPFPQPPAPDFNRWLTFHIIRWALHESIALYGLVITFISWTFTEMLPFAAAAIILNLLSMPRNVPNPLKTH